MALAIGGAVRGVTQFKVANLQVGKAATLVVAMGVGDVVKALTTKVSGGKVPQWVGGLLLAYALANIKQVRNILGPDLAELAALGILADSIDDQADLQQKTANWLAKLFKLGVVVSASPPVLRPPAATGAPNLSELNYLYRGLR